MKSPAARFASFVETLEDRRLLSSITLSNGVLTIIGNETADVIEVQNRSDKGQLQVELNGTERRFAFSSVKQIVINALGGNDWVEYNGREDGLAVPGFIHGGTGNDTLQGGLGNDTINGGRGNDRIEGKEGDDILLGNLGNDSIQGGAGDDDVRGDAGRDSISGGRGNDDFFSVDDRREQRDRSTAEDGGSNRNR